LKRFQQYITEAQKLTHLEHVEDAIFDFGYEGAVEALKILEDVSHSLHGHTKKPVNIQAKVDGAPAVIAGINPENGKFFVGTKALFNKTPKINYTDADIDANHGKSAGLAAKLKVALREFPKLGLKGVYQGDFMYTPEDLKKETIDGEKYVTFTPNTITYAIPLGTDLAKHIIKSKVGIVWHTTYTGNTIADLSAQFKIDISAMKKSKDVWFTDTNFTDVSGTATLTVGEMKAIEKSLQAARNELNKLDKPSLEVLFGKTKIAAMVKIYINTMVRQGQRFSGRQKAMSTFIDFAREKYQKEIDKLKSEKGKAKKQVELDDFLKNIRSKKLAGTFVYALQWHDTIIDIKMILIKKMEKVNKIPAFIKTDSGYKVTGPEGFVAIDTLSNSAVKLVDRLEFSRANFTAVKSWS